MARLRAIGRLLVIALPLYFTWEMLQAPAFTGMPDDWKRATAWCALAALGDGVIVLSLFVFGRLVFRTPHWFVPPRIGRYAAVIAVGSVTQGAIERTALGLGLWGYVAGHPTIFGVGIMAIMQVVLLLPLTFWLLARWERALDRKRGRT